MIVSLALWLVVGAAQASPPWSPEPAWTDGVAEDVAPAPEAVPLPLQLQHGGPGAGERLPSEGCARAELPCEGSLSLR